MRPIFKFFWLDVKNEIQCGKYLQYADSLFVSAYFYDHYLTHEEYNNSMTKVDYLVARLLLIPSSVGLVNDQKR